MSRSTKTVCLYAMGIALFVVLTMCLQVPVFENYYLCLGYVVVAVYCYSFGPTGGSVVGAVGVVIYCLLTNGLRGMPGWALGNVVIGLGLGVVFRATKKWPNKALQWALNALAVITFVAAGILVVKSGAEFVIYGQPFLFRMTKNMYAFIADVVLLLVSLPVCWKMDEYLHRYMRISNE